MDKLAYSFSNFLINLSLCFELCFWIVHLWWKYHNKLKNIAGINVYHVMQNESERCHCCLKSRSPEIVTGNCELMTSEGFGIYLIISFHKAGLLTQIFTLRFSSFHLCNECFRIALWSLIVNEFFLNYL